MMTKNLVNQRKWQILTAQHKNLSLITETQLLEAELEALREFGIDRDQWPFFSEVAG
jgi:hypothetical protein